ncbi:MAG: hypothetical protein AAB578_00240, partial [Elusimicrobiota bacterium]
MRELKRQKAEMETLQGELDSLLGKLKLLRESYFSSSDPSSLQAKRLSLRGAIEERMRRLHELRKEFDEVLGKNEYGGYSKAVEVLERNKYRGYSKFLPSGLDEYSAHQEMVAFVKNINHYRERLEVFLREDEVEYERTLRNWRLRRNLYAGLGAAAFLIAVFFVFGRLHMRVLAQPQTLPVVSGASASYVLLGGAYRLERELGKDRLGVCYAAVDVKKGEPVIVWLLREDAGFTPAGAKAAAAAAQRAAAVRHPGIAGIRAILQEDDRLCLVLDAMEGSPLNSLLGEGKRASL